MNVQRAVMFCNKVAFAIWQINQRQSDPKKFDDFAFHNYAPKAVKSI